MTKRVLSLVLAMLTLFSLCAPALATGTGAADEPEAAANIVDSGYCGDYYTGQTYNVSWTLTSDGTLTISGHGNICNCQLNAAPWCQYDSVNQMITNDRIKAVIIKSGVTGIGAEAFRGHGNLRSVTLSNSVTHIDEMAFFWCNKLTSITIPKSVKTIGFVAFGECSGLKTITILNKNCVIEDNNANHASTYYSLGVPGKTTVIGWAGSTAESYARKHGFSFQALHDGWTKENGRTYYYRDGAKLNGLQTISGKKYYFSAEDGRMLTGLVNTGGGKLRYFSVQDGHMLTGLVNTGNGKVRYFSVRDGHMLTGLVNTGNGKVRYFSAKDGHMLTGLVTVDNKDHQCYFSAKDGRRLTGLVNTGGGIRYFSAKTGYMLKGLVTVDNKGHQCYFSAKNGYRLKGLVTTDNKGTRRFFNMSTGYMVKDQWVYVNGIRYYANANGVVTRR